MTTTRFARVARRAVKAKPPVPCQWMVRTNSHFPQTFGPFDTEAEADACVAEDSFGRSKAVAAWKNADEEPA